MDTKTCTEQLITVLTEQGITRSESEVAEFAKHVKKAENYQRNWNRLLQSPQSLATLDILRLIAEAQQAGDYDEAIWRGFLAGHFGRASADPLQQIQVESAGLFLCGFGQRPMWTWAHVSTDLDALRDWLLHHRTDRKSTRLNSSHR